MKIPHNSAHLASRSLLLMAFTLSFFFISCEDPSSIINPIDSKGFRVGLTTKEDTAILQPLVVTIVDSTAKKLLERKKKNHKLNKSDGRMITFDQDPCSGTEYLYVGGMNFQEALDASRMIFQGNPCTIIWVSGPQISVTVTRDVMSENESLWTISFINPNSVTSYLLGAGSGAPIVGGTTGHATNIELAILAGLHSSQLADYYDNYQEALHMHQLLIEDCDTDGDGQPDIGNINGNANAFLHAYWTALNAQDLGDELALRLVSAHELWAGNLVDPARMDLYNDDLGLTVARQYSSGTPSTVIMDRVLSRVLTGHGRRIVNGSFQRTSFNICE